MNLICALFGHNFRGMYHLSAGSLCYCLRCGKVLDCVLVQNAAGIIVKKEHLAQVFNALAGGPSPHESDRALIASLVNKMPPPTEVEAMEARAKTHLDNL